MFRFWNGFKRVFGIGRQQRLAEAEAEFLKVARRSGLSEAEMIEFKSIPHDDHPIEKIGEGVLFVLPKLVALGAIFMWYHERFDPDAFSIPWQREREFWFDPMTRGPPHVTEKQRFARWFDSMGTQAQWESRSAADRAKYFPEGYVPAFLKQQQSQQQVPDLTVATPTLTTIRTEDRQ